MLTLLEGGEFYQASRVIRQYCHFIVSAEPATIMAMSAAAPDHHAHLLVFRIPSLLEDFTLSSTFLGG